MSNYRKFNMYVYHCKAAKHFLDSIEEREGQTYNCMAVIIFSAFAVETFVNHIGEMQIDDLIEWDGTEKPKLITKIKRLGIDISPSFKAKLNRLMRLRDIMAHSKTETNTKKQWKPPNNPQQAWANLENDLEKYSKPKQARELFDFMVKFIEYVNTSSGITLSRVKLWSLGSGGYQLNLSESSK